MNLFDRAITLSTRRPGFTLLVIFLICLLAVPGIVGFDSIPGLDRIKAWRHIGGIEQDNSNEGYLGSFSRFHIENDYVEDVFGDTGSGVFIAVEADNIYTFETLAYVNRIHERMEVIPGVTEVSSIISLEDVTGRGDEIRSFEMIEKNENGQPMLPRTDRELARLRSRLESNDIFESVVYSKKRNDLELPLAWNIAISIEENEERSTELVNQIEAELDELEDERFATYLFGGDILSREVDNS